MNEHSSATNPVVVFALACGAFGAGVAGLNGQDWLAGFLTGSGGGMATAIAVLGFIAFCLSIHPEKEEIGTDKVKEPCNDFFDAGGPY